MQTVSRYVLILFQFSVPGKYGAGRPSYEIPGEFGKCLETHLLVEGVQYKAVPSKSSNFSLLCLRSLRWERSMSILKAQVKF